MGISASSRIRSPAAALAPGVAATRLTAASSAVPIDVPVRVARALSASRRSAGSIPGRDTRASYTGSLRFTDASSPGSRRSRTKARPAGLSSANGAPLVSRGFHTGSSVVIVESRTYCR